MKADEDYVEAVLCLVEAVPSGRVTTYGSIAEVVGSGPRLVGNVLARHGAGVPWWRVVRADGSLPGSHLDRARPSYLDEGTPLRSSGRGVDLAAAYWQPPATRAPAGPGRAGQSGQSGRTGSTRSARAARSVPIDEERDDE